MNRGVDKISSFRAQGQPIPHTSYLMIMASFALLVYVVISVVGDVSLMSPDYAVVATFVGNGLLGSIALFREILKKPFSLCMIHWLFYVTFFAIAPLAQYLHGYSCWGYPLTDGDCLSANLLLLIWALLFLAFSSGSARRKLDGSSVGYDDLFYRIPNVSKTAVAVVMSLSLIATGILIVLVGFNDLFARDTFSFGVEQKSTGLLLDKVLRSTPVFAFLFVFVRYRQSKDMRVALAICAGLLLLADFPTGMARYNMAFVYGGLIIVCSRRVYSVKGLFCFIFLLGFLVIFPAINVFRVNEFDPGLFFSELYVALGNVGSGFMSADYDAYSLFARALDYVELFGAGGGTQLLGALLFFVPRSFWAGKPYGSGQTIAEAQGQIYTNLSCPLPAEGVINFGFLGLILFAVMFALICSRLDRRGCAGKLGLFYPFSCLLFFFMMRGDLMSSFAYAAGNFVVFACMRLIVERLAGVSVDSSELSSRKQNGLWGQRKYLKGARGR